ncbi:MAG TPA: hypothetical protein VGB70_12820 [Allosphingosinicella sp.]|jgi:hypothetical protein
MRPGGLSDILVTIAEPVGAVILLILFARIGAVISAGIDQLFDRRWSDVAGEPPHVPDDVQ